MNAATITASALGACLRPAPATEQQEVIEDEPTHLEVSLGTQVGRPDASATTRACVMSHAGRTHRRPPGHASCRTTERGPHCEDDHGNWARCGYCMVQRQKGGGTQKGMSYAPWPWCTYMQKSTKFRILLFQNLSGLMCTLFWYRRRGGVPANEPWGCRFGDFVAAPPEPRVGGG